MAVKDSTKPRRCESAGIYVADTAEHAGDFSEIKAFGAVVFASITSSTITGSMASLPLASGEILEGRVSKFTLTSGKVIAYTHR